MTYKNKNITIIGGTKGLGKWIALKLIEDKFNVKITSRNKEEGMKIAEKIGASYSNDNIEAIKNADIIIFSVPIEYMVETIKQVAPHAPENSLLIDVTSVKIEPSKALEQYSPKTCEILPCHPMFGPRIPTLDGQVIILTPIEKRCEYWYDKVIHYLEDNNTNIVISSPQEHDKIMSVVQGITHFSYISIASTIKQLDVSVKRSRDFASPIYNLMLDMISRIVSQNPYLYYSIQKSNYLTKIARKTLIEESLKLSEFIENDEEDKFIDKMRESAKHLDEFEEALGRSDKAISVLTDDINKLKESIGNEIGLEHQYSHNIHVGIVKKVNAKNVIITDYNNKEITLKLSNVNILTKEELKEWKLNNLQIYSYDVSIVLPDTCDEHIILDIINKIDEVITVKFVDKYVGKQIKENKISLTFNYTTFNKEDRFIVEKYIEGIGGIIR